EVVALQHPLHGDLARQGQHVEEAELTEPVAVAMHLRPIHVNDSPNLPLVIEGIGLDLFLRQAGPGLVATAGIPDESGVVADDEDRLVSQLLEQSKLAERDGVSQVDINAGRVDAVLDAKRLAGGNAALELCPEGILGNDLLDAAADQGKLLIDTL